MFQIDQMGSVDRQSRADYQEYQKGMSYSTKYAEKEQETIEIDSANKLYDRLDTQWAAFLEIGFVLSAITGTGAVICLMRVFGAGALALSVALMVVIAIALLIIFFWRDLNNSEYKLRAFLIAIATIAGLIISMSDMAIDGSKHYWAILSGASMIFGATSVVVLGLIMAAKQDKD